MALIRPELHSWLNVLSGERQRSGAVDSFSGTISIPLWNSDHFQQPALLSFPKPAILPNTQNSQADAPQSPDLLNETIEFTNKIAVT